MNDRKMQSLKMSLQDFLKVVEMWWKEFHSTDNGSDEEDEAEKFLHFDQRSIGGPQNISFNRNHSA